MNIRGRSNLNLSLTLVDVKLFHTLSSFLRGSSRIAYHMANHQPIQIQRPIFRQNKDDKGSDKSSNHGVLILEYEFIITGVESLLLLCD